MVEVGRVERSTRNRCLLSRLRDMLLRICRCLGGRHGRFVLIVCIGLAPWLLGRRINPNEINVRSSSVGTKGHHHCLNDDFKPQHSVAFWTMLNDNPKYVTGAVKLGRALSRHTARTPHDRVVMELEHKPLSDESWSVLRSVGYQRCVVHPIPPPNPEKTRSDLREKFAVLHVWAMTVYERLVFLDADTYPRASIDHLLTMDLQGKPIGVTKDIRDRKWVHTFNTGVLLLNPNLAEHTRLVQLLHSGMKFEYIMSDQGFLNEVYGSNWHEIGFVNNANLALYRFQREFWDQHPIEDINIIHYTMQKPWKCKSKGPYGPICDIWINDK